MGRNTVKKRSHHRQDTSKLNKIALVAGGILAGVILAIIICSLLF